jgi:iron complex outermembrane receptor protein
MLCSAAFITTAEAAVVSPDAGDREPGAFSPVTLRDRPLDALMQSAAAVDVRYDEDFADNYADDLGDGLFFAPGVQINALDIQEPRLSIRGFAVGNDQHRSNVRLLRDGAPLTDVHGTTNSTEVDLLSTDKIIVHRGVANLREGGELGGVVHLVSHTGKTARPGLTARAEGGSTVDAKAGGQAHVAFAGANSGMDYYAGVTGVYENGWRDNNRRTSQQFHGNIGFRLGSEAETRFYADVVNSKTELAGGLTLGDLESDPQAPTPPITLGPLFPGGPVINLVDGARADDFARDIREGRIANNTKFGLLWHDFEIGGHYTRREIESPQIDFVGFVEEEGSEWGARLQAERSVRLFGSKATYRFGGDYTTGDRDSLRFENNAGTAGDILTETNHKSKIINGFVEGVYQPLRRLAVDVGAKFTTVDRELADLTTDDLETEDYTGVSARAGVQFEVSEALQVYVSASRAWEPPTMDELTSGDPTDFIGLEEQDSFTIEGGLRGRLGNWVGYDIAYYDTDVENEIINVAAPSSFVSGDIFENANTTTHKGIEAGVDVHLFPESMASRGGALTLRNVYTHSNHRFVDAGDVGDVDGNRLGGVPVHQYRGEIRYDADNVWFFAANVTLAGGSYYADHENTTSVPTDPVVGFSAGYRLSDQIEVFASGENLLDQTYVAGVAPVLTLDPDADRIFTPGQRATVYGGLKYKF